MSYDEIIIDPFQDELESMIREEARPESIFNYCRSTNEESPSCVFFLGTYYFSKGDFKKSKKHFTNSLDSNFEAISFYALGRIALYEENYSEALKLLTRSQKLNCGRAYYWLGNIYLNGFGIDKDEKKALNFFKKGAVLGYIICKRADLYFSEYQSKHGKFCYFIKLIKFYINALTVASGNINDERMSDHGNWKNWYNKIIMYPL